MQGVENIIACTVFTPVVGANPAVFANRNFTGVVGAATDAPLRIAAGHWQVTANGSFVNTMMSINARAYNAAGLNRLVTVVPNASLGDRTVFDIFLATDVASTPSDDALFVEVTIRRLPL